MPQPGQKRLLFLLSLSVLLPLFLFSCKREPRIKLPQALIKASSADAKRLLPMLADDSASGEISGLIFNGLTKYDKDIKITGDLAKSWEIKNHGLEIIFHLRKGVKWQDGKEFTADDVVFTYQKVIDPKVPTPYSSSYGPVESVDALDRYTVRVRYKEPFAPALESWGMGIIPKHLLEGKDISTEEFTRHPIGTGPYKLKEWITGQSIVLTAFDECFEGKPGIPKIIIRVIPDTATRYLELKFGGIDVLDPPTPGEYKLSAETDFFRSNFQNFRYPMFGYSYMGYNLLDKRFQDVRVRRALSHAINKKDIIKGVLMGYGSPCTGPFPPESWAYNPSVPEPEYNPKRALELFKEAGWTMRNGRLWKNGEPFSFTILLNQGNTPRLLAGQMIQEDLRKVGVSVHLKVLEWQAFLHNFIEKKRFEAYIMGWGLSRDPDLYEIWHSSKTKEGEFNLISYKNDEVDRLLIEGRQTFDMEKRKKIYHRIHEILAYEQPYTFLFVPDSLVFVHKRIKGIVKAPAGISYDQIHWHVPAKPSMW